RRRAGSSAAGAAGGVRAAAPVAVATLVAGGPRGARLGRPATVFAVAYAASTLALFLVPPPPPASRAPQALRLLRAVLRRPAAVLLAGGAAGYVLVAIFGDALMPQSGRLSPPMADVLVSLRFLEGTTVEEAEEIVARAEAVLSERADIDSHWSVFTRSFATLGIDATPEIETSTAVQTLAARVEMQLQRLGASVTARPFGVAGGGEPLRFNDRLIEPPEIDERITRYRFLLKSPDAEALRRALALVDEGRRRHRDLRESAVIVPDWRPPAEQWHLVPHPSASTRDVDRAALRLAESGAWSAAVPTLGLRGRSDALELRVLAADAPATAREASELSTALAPKRDGDSYIVPSELFEVREELGSPTLRRQRGSFVLPVVIHLRGLALGERPMVRNTLHTTLRNLAWPAEVDVQLPRLRPKRFTEDRLRLLTIAATLPLLMLGLAICRLDSIPLGLSTALGPSLGLAATAPWLSVSGTGADELTWLTLAATLAMVWAFSAEVTARVRVRKPSRLAVGPGYRWLSRRLPPIAAVALGFPLGLALPTWGLTSDQHLWVTSLRTGALAAVAGLVGATLLVPVLLRATDRLRFYDRAAARLRAHPPAWADEVRGRDQTPDTDGAPVDSPPSPPPAGSEFHGLHLETQNLNKIYSNGFQALSQVDLSLRPGIIGLLGPNGAGKSTLLRCLCGLLEPTRGRVLFRGEPVTPQNLPRYRRLVGFLPQAFNAYEGATVEAFLDFWALEIGLLDTAERRRELDAVLEQVGLSDARARKVRELSGGMRRRIGIARALLGSPPIVIVDEPTTGLDVESRQRLRDSLLQAAGDRIILFSTHIASDIATTASRILILDGGRLRFDGSPGDLIDGAHGRVFERLLDDAELRDFSGRYRVTTRVRTLDGIRVRAVATVDQEPAGELVRPNLEEAYLATLSHGVHAPGGERRTGSLLDLKA
ncbi:MAG: ABC transporter ATP-binding protein, partial [Acidobacteriota bacterium]